MTETISQKLSIITENIPLVYNAGVEAGNKAERNFFWGVYQNNGAAINYVSKFYAWKNSLYNPEYPIRVMANVSSTGIFRYSEITDTKVDIIFETGCDVSYAFYSCKFLKTIRKIICNEAVKLNDTFDTCPELEDVAFEGVVDYSLVNFSSSTKLTKTSIISIFSVLSTIATGCTLKLSLAAVNKVFETSEGANDGSTSPEWLALVATKENWTITLA